MAAESTPAKTGPKRLGELLVESGMLSAADLEKGLDYGKKTGMAIGRVLVMLRLVSDADLRAVLHVQSLMKFESMPGNLAVRALSHMRENKVHIEYACKQIGWNSAKFKGDMPPRLRELKEKLADTEQRLGADHPDLAQALLELAKFYEDEEMWAHAEANCQLAIDKLERALGPAHLKLSQAHKAMGSLLFMQDRFEEAQSCYQQSFDIVYKTLGNDSLEVAQSMYDLAEVLEVQKKFGDAERMYLQCVAIREKYKDIDEPEMLDLIKRLSFVCSRRGRAPDQVLVGQMLTDSGMISEDKIPEALAYSKENNMPLARALVALNYLSEEQLKPVLHAQLLVKSNLLPGPLATRILRLCGKRKIAIEEAMALAGWVVQAHRSHNISELLATHDALVAAERTTAADSPDIAALCLKLADLYESYERYADAEPLYRRSLSIIEKQSINNPPLLEVLDKLGLMSLRQAKYEQAESIYKRVLDMRQDAHGADHPDVATSYMNLGRMYQQKGEHSRAVLFYQRALPIAEKAYGNDHALVAEIVEQLALGFYETSEYECAEPLFWRAFKLKSKYQDTQSSEITSLLTKLADLYNKQGQYNMADSVLAMLKENKSVFL